MGNQTSKQGDGYKSMREPKETDRLTNVGGLIKETEEVKDIALQDMKKLEERGDNLKELEITSQKLKENAEIFEEEAKKVKDKKCCEHYKLWIILITIVTVIVLILVVIIVVTIVKLVK